MTIVILGSNGMLGSMMTFIGNKQRRDILPIGRDRFDILKDHIGTLEQIISGADYVINCIGAIPQKQYSTDDYKILNGIFPHTLNALCKKIGARLIHISTNCVFSGSAPNMIETDRPDATDVYGKSKADGEPDDCQVVRCSIIGLEKGEGRGSGLLEWFLRNKAETVHGFTDSYWNGLTTLELTNQIYKIIDENRWNRNIQHFYSENTLSKYELLEVVKHIWKKEICILPKENGVKHYTLLSKRAAGAVGRLEEQLEELSNVERDFRELEYLVH